VGGWVRGLVLRKDKTRQDNTQDKKGLTFICSPTFFLAKKEHHPQTKIRFELRDLKPALRSQVKKTNFSNQISQALSLSLIKERRRFHRLPNTYTTFWMDGSLTFHKQTFFPSQNLLQICSLSLSLTHTHTQNSSSFLQNSNTKFNWKPQS
jgi:hypothetical protein